MLVGVFRNTTLTGLLSLRSCPHARGGVPDRWSATDGTVRRCPHARGGVPDSTLWGSEQTQCCPHARGGVPVESNSALIAYHGCPHARGGVPRLRSSVQVVLEPLSPCSWGCSANGGALSHCDSGVVPMLVGVFRLVVPN